MRLFMPYQGQVCEKVNTYLPTEFTKPQWDKVVVKCVVKPIIGSEKQWVRFHSLSGELRSLYWDEFVSYFQPTDDI